MKTTVADKNRTGGASGRHDPTPPTSALLAAASHEVLFEASPLPMYVFDLDTLRFLAVNRAAVEQYGYSRVEFLNLTLADIRPPEDVPAMQESARSRPEGLDRAGIWRHRCKNGRVIMVEITTHGIQWAGRSAKLVLAHDVTERMVLEAERELLTLAVEQAAEIVMITDARGAIQYVNPAFERVSGYGRAEVLGQNPRLLKSGQQDECFYRHLWRTLANGDVWTGEFANLCKDGSLYFEEATISPVRNAAGTVVSYVAVKRDVTERRRMETQLAQSEARYRELFDAAPHPMWVYDLETLRFLEVNEAAVQHYGYTREEFLDLTLEEIRPPEEVPDLVLHAALPRDGAPNASVRRHAKKDGTVIFARLTSRRIQFNGRPAGLVLAEDVTDRTRMEEALMETEGRFRQLTDSIREVFWLIDPRARRTIYISPSFEKIWGMPCAEMYRNPDSWFAAVHADDRKRVARLLATAPPGNEYDAHYRIVRPDGAVRWIHDQSFPVRDEAGEVYRIAGVAEDVTEQRELESQLRQVQRLESVGQLTAGLAHDFNNVLAVVQGHTDLLLLDCPPGSPAEESLKHISQAARRAANLTRQLLAFSRKQVMQPRDLDLNEVLGHMAKMLRRALGETVTLDLDCAETPTLVHADVNMIEQVVLNLTLNARDAMPRGGRLRIQTRHLVFDAASAGGKSGSGIGAHVCLSVTDTGCGIAPEVMPHIFEPFFTTKEIGKGSGLGLATVYGIVKQHQGWIHVDSKPGAGATFEIYLPASTNAVVQPDVPTSQPLPVSGGATILLVEDDPGLRDVARRILRRAGYNVLEAGSGPAALALLRHLQCKPDLLLTDMMMPDGMTGRELAEQILALHPGTRVILTSGYSNQLDDTAFLLENGILFLPKPYSPQTLGEAIHKCLSAPPQPVATASPA